MILAEEPGVASGKKLILKKKCLNFLAFVTPMGSLK